MDHLVHVGLGRHLHAERLLLPRLEGEAALPPLHQVGLLPRVEGGVGGEDHFDLGGEEERQNEFISRLTVRGAADRLCKKMLTFRRLFFTSV